MNYKEYGVKISALLFLRLSIHGLYKRFSIECNFLHLDEDDNVEEESRKDKGDTDKDPDREGSEP